MFLFMQVFFLVVSIGLFHGLVFLPVLLSIIGPRAYLASESDTENTSEMTAVECNPNVECVNIKTGKVEPEKENNPNGKLQE